MKENSIDAPPKESFPVEEKDPLYQKKLEYSYLQCLKELCEPCENWNEAIMETKFTIDPLTGQPRNSHTFTLSNNDNIVVQEVKHSYVFKRSHFYNSFNKKRSRLKRDLIECWKNRGYYVKLYKGESQWLLELAWKNS